MAKPELTRKDVLNLAKIGGLSLLLGSCSKIFKTEVPPTEQPLSTLSIEDLVIREWPTTVEEFVNKTKIARAEISDPALIRHIQNLEEAGVEVAELAPGLVHKELDGNEVWTGGWVIDPRRDPEKPPYFLNTVYLAKNPYKYMQHGYMNPDIYRNSLGLTPDEIDQLGWGQDSPNWQDKNSNGVSDVVGSGIPGGYFGLIEAATFYPLYSITDGRLHVFPRVLGSNVQTVNQRLEMNINNPIP